MDTLQSRLKPSFWIVPAIILIAAIASFYGFILIGSADKDGRYFLVLAIMLSLVASGRVYRFFTRNTGIIVSADAIILTYATKPNTIIQRSDMKAVQLVSLRPPMALDEGSAIELNDGTRILISPREYSNAGEIRSLIYRYYSGEESAVPKLRDHAGAAHEKTYSGNPWTSFNSILFYFICASAILSFIVLSQPVLLIFIAIIYFLTSPQMYYFKVAGDSLTVRNHYRPWYKRNLKLEDIRLLIYQPGFRLSNGLGIITMEFCSRGFRAGSLRKKDWRELMKDMQAMHIEFINGIS